MSVCACIKEHVDSPQLCLVIAFSPSRYFFVAKSSVESLTKFNGSESEPLNLCKTLDLAYKQKHAFDFFTFRTQRPEIPGFFQDLTRRSTPDCHQQSKQSVESLT